MNINELYNELERLGISHDLYSIMPIGMPNEKLCLVCEDEWKIFYSERGSKTGEKSYSTEEEACEAFLEKMERLPKDTPNEIVTKSLNIDRDYIYNAIHDSRKYWMEYHLYLLRRILTEEGVDNKAVKCESLLNLWFTEKHWSSDRGQFRFVEISDSKSHDTYRIEEPREGSII